MSEGVVWGIVGVVATLTVGVPIAILIARRFSSAPILRRAVSFERLSALARGLGGGLSLSFKGRDLESVSRTYLALWHERGNAVRRSDVLQGDPLRVVVEDSDEILQVRVLSRSNPLNDFGIRVHGAERVLEFEYLDRRDGGVIEVLHIGSRPAKIVGTIPGATIKKPRTVVLDASPRSGTIKPHRWWRVTDRRSRRRFLLLLAGVLSTVYVIAGGLALLYTALRVPRLVNDTKYNLATLEGQDDFASAVARVGNVDGLITTMVLVLVIGMAVVALFSWVLFTRIGRGVPREILEPVTEDVSEESLTEVKRLLDTGTEVATRPAPVTVDTATVLGGIVLEALRRTMGPKSD